MASRSFFLPRDWPMLEIAARAGIGIHPGVSLA